MADVVRFASLGDPALTVPARGPVLWSPDGEKAVVLVRFGDPVSQLNHAELLLYSRAALRKGNISPRLLARFASATNDQPIADVRWLPGSDRLVFAAADATMPAQLFELTLQDGNAVALTHEPTSLRYSDVTPSGQHGIATFAQRPVPPSQNPECVQTGCLVTAETLYAAEHGISDGPPPLVYLDFAAAKRTVLTPTERVESAITECRDGRGGGISPDGAYVLRVCRRRQRDTPLWWRDYANPPGLREFLERGSTSVLRQWMIVDLRNDVTRRLSDAPTLAANVRAAPLWIDGGAHLILPGAFEPLTDVSAAERTLRAAHFAVLMLDPRTLETQRIGRLDARAQRVMSARWEPQKQTVFIETRDANRAPLPVQAFRRRGDRWVAVEGSREVERKADIDLIVTQSLNDPPVLVATQARSGKRQIVLDPNPWLAQRTLAKPKSSSGSSRAGRRGAVRSTIP